jgi:hypothetical protein
MRDILRNPILYYVLAPVLIGLWPLLVWAVYLPRVERTLTSEIAQYHDANECIREIWEKDPGRADQSGASPGSGVFTPGEAVSRVAVRCDIPSRHYDATAGDKTKLSGKVIQEVKVTLTDVGIVQACRFLSTIQSMWVNLDCKGMRLTKKDVSQDKKEGSPDSWDVDLSFKYTY